jgi:hypothetical protein
MNYSGDSYNNTKISSFMSRRLFMWVLSTDMKETSWFF